MQNPDQQSLSQIEQFIKPGIFIVAQITSQDISAYPLAYRLTNAELTIPFKP